ncbi:MAG TPA: hypothetical protein VNZ58_10745 [Thermomicrobiales bacterium]|nr:hypothetical protein [Thermomicrobiales bacterium]
MSARTKIAGIALSLTLLVGGGGVFAAQQSTYDRIENEMQDIRQLELLHPLDISIQTRDELRQTLLESIEQDYPEDAQQRDQRVMELFGFIEPGTDVGQLQIDLLGEQVAGYYDPETKAMVVVSDGSGDQMSASDEITFAHETVHALQDQHFDLIGVQDSATLDADDQYLAITALIEGDASLGQVQYMVAHPALVIRLQSEMTDFDSTILDNASPFISGTLLFPYDQGLTFVTALYDEGGWDLVDQAFTNLPQSTEQILHPGKYLAGEAPIPVTVNDPLPALGDDWHIIDVNTLGEYIIQIFLDTGEVRPSTAQDAAEGWGGDQYVVAGTDDDTALIWTTEWDSEKDAEEFFTVLGVHESKRFDAERVTDDTVTTFSNDDFAGEIRLDGTRVTYILAPDTATVADLFANQSAPGEPAIEQDDTPVATPVS